MDSMDIHHLDFESSFEPQFRARSNTWPQRPPRELEPHSSPVAGDEHTNSGEHHGSKDPLGLTAKKSGSRRNAWGNLSYADLITKAIQSSPEKRLTLSQIYDWMVQNVPYFKDKGDSTSSAGWKNSIRHNLSLHNRFMRIQNEGTGKSSWWVLNPDAKPGKTPRRRAGSMETKCYEKKRGRIRKKVEALRAGLENGTLSPVSCDDYLDGLSFVDFRPRAGSSTSNCSRLSPISAAAEPDLNSGEIQPMSSIPWGSEVSNSPAGYTDTVYSDLVESLVEGMKLSNQDGLKMDMISGINGAYLSDSSSDYSQPSPYSGVNQSSPGLDNHYTQLPAPPPYPQQQQQQQVNGIEFHPQNFTSTHNFNSPLQLQIRPTPTNNGPATFSPTEMFNDSYSDSVLGMKQEALSPVRMTTSNSLSVNTQHLGSPEQGSPSSGSYAHHSPQGGLPNGLSLHACKVSPQQSRHLLQQQQITTASLQQQALNQAANDSLLRDNIIRSGQTYRSHTSSAFSLGHHTPIGALPPSGNMNIGMSGIGLVLSSNSNPHCQSLMAGQFRGIREYVPNGHTIPFNGMGAGGGSNLGVPLDIDMDLMGISVMDYDMDQVIKQELSLEGNLDFIFDAGAAAAVGQNVVH